MLLGPPNSGASLIRPESHESRSTASSQTCTLGCSLHCPSAAHPPSLGNIRAIELEIDARTATIMCPLRRLRNAHIPVGKLPDEVLVQIFGSWIKDDPFSLRAQLTLASVSHRWRNVMMSEGPFWSFIRIRGDRWRAGPQDATFLPSADFYRCMAVRALIGRSSPYPISVDIAVDPRNDDAANCISDDIKQVLAYAPRIREFSCICMDQFKSGIDRMLHEFGPNFRTMRTFMLTCFGRDAYNADCFFPRGPPPSLVELSLINCFIDWNHLQTLTLAKLHIVVDEIQISPDWRDVMVHLAPFLQDFRLATDSISTVSPGSRIHMAQLQDLSFTIHSDSFLSFIDCLQLPISARVSWKRYRRLGGSLAQPRLEHLIPFVNSHFGRVFEKSSMSLSCLSQEFTIAMNEGNGRITMDTYRLDPRHVEEFISELDPTIAWSFDTLTVHEYAENEPFPWKILSSRLPRVSLITLKTQPEPFSGERGPLPLTSSLIDAWAASNGNIIFPMVTHLCVVEKRLEDVDQPSEQQLLAALRARRRAGRPIVHIHLDESSAISGYMRQAIGPHTKVSLEDRELPAWSYKHGVKGWKGSRLRAELRKQILTEEDRFHGSTQTNDNDEEHTQSSDESDSIYDGLVTQLLVTQ